MKVFISHAFKDREPIRRLVEQLSREGFDVWYDEAEVEPGENFAAKAGRAIESAQAMIVVLSEESASSPWVQREIDYALGSPNYKNRVVTVLADRKAEVPWILRRFPVVEVRKGNFSEAGKRVAEELREVPAR